MKQEQIDAWKRVRHAGTVAMVFGWLGIVGVVFFILLGVLFLALNTPIPTSSYNSSETIPSVVYGVIFIVVALVFVLPISIVEIVAGFKLRKPVANPKGWIIFLIVIGALGITSIPGIFELIFGVLALSTLHVIEGTEPPKQLT